MTDKTFKEHGPWLHIVRSTSSELTNWVFSVRLGDPNAVAVILRGRKMRTLDGLYDEFSAALQFPPYFGENWDAFDECITDLSWLPGEIYLITVESADELLADEDDQHLKIFLELLRNAGEEWSQPSGLGEEWARGPRPFHLVMQTEPMRYDATRKRVNSSGVLIGDYRFP